MKKGLFILTGLLWCINLAAQRDTTFFNADWDTVPGRDGAAYFRLFDKLDYQTKQYYFNDYYITGEKQNSSICLDPKCIRKSGEWTWYHKNGQISQIGTYVEGRQDGDWYKYFDNGDLQSKLTHINDNDNPLNIHIEYRELYDEKSREHLLANGEGLYLTYLEDGDTSTIGQVNKMCRTGTWKEYRETGELYYVEEHKNGELLSGVSYDEEGKKYTYTDEGVMPSYEGGQGALLWYLAKIDYPHKARENDIEGTVYIQFVIDNEGNVTEASIKRSSGHLILDNAALLHVSKSRKWTPGYQRGQPIKVQYVVPIKFKLT